jgi:hypothetical protein
VFGAPLNIEGQSLSRLAGFGCITTKQTLFPTYMKGVVRSQLSIGLTTK